MPEEGREGGGIGLIREGVVTGWCVRTKVKSAIYVSTPTVDGGLGENMEGGGGGGRCIWVW